MQMSSFIAVGPVFTEKLIATGKKSRKSLDREICHEWPRSKLYLEIIKINILCKVYDNHLKDVTSSV